MDIATKLRVQRAIKGWTQMEVAEVTGVDQKTISDAESGKQRPQLRTLARLAAVYGVPVETLILED